MEAKTPPHNSTNHKKGGTTRPQVRKRQQEQKDKLAGALRDNLRRRKIAKLDDEQNFSGSGK